MPNNKLAPEPRASAASRMDAGAGARPHLQLLQHGGPGGRRLHAGEGRAAPRDRARLQDAATRSRSSARARRSRRSTPYSPGVAGYDPSFRTTRRRVRRAQGEGAARHVRLRRSRRRRLPRDARRHAARAQGATRRPRRATSSSTSCGSAAWTTSASASASARRKWPDLLKESNAGKLQFWQLGGSASAPDADTWLQSLYGPNAGYKGNRARFRLAAYDRLYEQARMMPDSPERTKLYQEMAQDRRRLRAAEVQHAPHPHRHVVPVGDRLPPPADARQPFLEVHRHRPGASPVKCGVHEPARSHAPLALALPRSPLAAPRAADPTRSCATPSRSPRPASTRTRISDLYSNIVNGAMFDAPLALRLPRAAAQAEAQHRRGAARGERRRHAPTRCAIKPGIYFADDPAFKGKKRELVAADYVYSMKRVLDPKLRASQIAELEPHVVGAEEAVATARKAGKFDYDAPIEGMQGARPLHLPGEAQRSRSTSSSTTFADCRIACAVAREVVEHYGEDVGAHPVGTGPYRLAFWKRSSKIVLEANPNYPRGVLRRRARRRRRARPGDPRAA